MATQFNQLEKIMINGIMNQCARLGAEAELRGNKVEAKRQELIFAEFFSNLLKKKKRAGIIENRIEIR